MVRRLLLLSLLAVVLVPAAEAKRRSAAAGGPASEEPAAWLARHAYVLRATELPAPSDDLEPLRTLVGNAHVVGLGDGTHGTHEFYTIKLRAIDFLVREMNFDVVAFEAPMPLFSRIDEYVQGGTTDPRPLLADAYDRLGYRFWDVSEMLAVIEWMRDYNAHRGSKPAVHIAGMDVFDATGAAQSVVAYLRTVDPAIAPQTELEYGCTILPSDACLASVRAIRDDLIARRSQFEPLGAQAYEEALQNALIVIQNLRAFRERDENMAANVRWLREHRSQTGKTIVWAHEEHVGQIESDFVETNTMGFFLASSLGSDYFAIGTLTGTGTLLQWDQGGPTGVKTIISKVPAPTPDSYEANFRKGPASLLLIPLTGTVPSWLAGPAPYFAAGTVPLNFIPRASLPAKFDAVIYIENTRATTPLRQ